MKKTIKQGELVRYTDALGRNKLWTVESVWNAGVMARIVRIGEMNELTGIAPNIRVVLPTHELTPV